MLSSCRHSGNGFSVGIQDKFIGGACNPGIRECSPNAEDKNYKYNCPDSGICQSVTRRCGPRINNCQNTDTETCVNNHLCKNNCVAPDGGINNIWTGENYGGRKGGWCISESPSPSPSPSPSQLNCTDINSGGKYYISDNNVRKQHCLDHLKLCHYCDSLDICYSQHSQYRMSTT